MSKIFLLLGWICLVPSSLPAQEQLNGASIDGTVVDRGTHRPISRARIALLRTGAVEGSAMAMTRDDGRFEFKNVSAGEYRLYVNVEGYVGTQYLDDSNQHVLSIVSGQRLSSLRIPISPTAVVHGRVVDKYREPISHVFVRLLRSLEDLSKPLTSLALEASTNDLGEFRIFGLAPGNYFVCAAPPRTHILLDDVYVRSSPLPSNGISSEGVSRGAIADFLERGDFIEPRALDSSPKQETVCFPGGTEVPVSKAIEIEPGRVSDMGELMLKHWVP